MPWIRVVHKPGIAGRIEEARESRGLSIEGAILAIRTVHLFCVRRELNNAIVFSPPIRQASYRLTDMAIADEIGAFDEIRLRAIEDGGEESPSPVIACACACAFDYPIHFFYQEDVPRAPYMTHITANNPDDPDWLPCYACICVSEFLCDFPDGQGTCDLPMCKDHAIKQGGPGSDLHYCPAHADIARRIVEAARKHDGSGRANTPRDNHPGPAQGYAV